MKSFAVQFRLMMKRKTFVITFAAAIIFAMLFFITECVASFNMDINDVAAAKFHFLGSIFGIKTVVYVYTLLFPLLAVVPFADSFFEEREKRTAEHCLTRISNNTYYFSKLFAVFCSGALIAAVPLLLNMLLNFIAFPLESTVDYTNFSYAMSSLFSSNVKTDLFTNLLCHNIYAYNFIHLVLASLFSGMAAVVVYQFSFFYKKSRIMLLCSFFIVYTFLDLLFNVFGLSEFCASTYIFGAQFHGGQSIRGIITVFVLISAAVFLPIPFAKKRLNDFYE